MHSNNPIVFLHLSDMHINNEKDIDDKHIRKIVDSLKTYKNIKFKDVIIVISGDITQAGCKSQFVNAKKLIGNLIIKLNKTFDCRCTILAVPGNHDINHGNSMLDVKYLKTGKYLAKEMIEYKKMEAFYDFAKCNKYFENNEIYYTVKYINISNLRIKVNLINNAIFSTCDQYKGLLYFPCDVVDKKTIESNDADFVITVMHHAPDYYRDDIKNRIEDTIIKKSNILFHGHEHYNYSKSTSFADSDSTIIQSGGCLCNNGNWNESSYIVGILYRHDYKDQKYDYKYQKFSWNQKSGQYEHNEFIVETVNENHSSQGITKDFLEYIYEDYNKDYFVFPSIISHNESTEDYKINKYERFQEEILQNDYLLITGNGNVGKTTLLKYLFINLAQKYYVVYGSAEKMLSTGKNKRRDIQKLIKLLFEDVYGADKSKWQAFEQSDKSECVFIFDDYNQIDGVNLNDLLNLLGERFGKVIISDSKTINFNPEIIQNIDRITKYEIESPIGHKRRELIRAVVREKASDKSESNVESIVQQIDRTIKTQLNLIPPEPYYIIQITENFMNNVGEAIYKNSNAFSKVFEANLTNRIDDALKRQNRNRSLTVDLMYVLFGKIAYFIHFERAYPIKRNNIDEIVNLYNREYGYSLETEDVIRIAKLSKILSDTEESSESFRFRNKSVLAYFVAKEIISQYNDTGDTTALNDIINKACINICTDILLFIIYLTDKTVILNSILQYIEDSIHSDASWCEFSIPNNIPSFLNNRSFPLFQEKSVNKRIEKKQIEKEEEKTEKSMVTSFKIRDIYDWDDNQIDNVNGRLFRMTSLLQIVSKCLPCFEHRLKRSEKEKLIDCLYTLPNQIFMFWSHMVEENYDSIIAELKTHPYFTNEKPKLSDNEIDSKAKGLFAVFSINLLLNLYYIPVLNASGKNTFQFLCGTDFFDHTRKITYKLEHLMFLEQNHESLDFINNSINVQKEANDIISKYLLQCIVRHGLITREDSLADVNKLESKFYPQKRVSGIDKKKSLLIERTKNKYSRK